jgi:hypothetical protein
MAIGKQGFRNNYRVVRIKSPEVDGGLERFRAKI